MILIYFVNFRWHEYDN